MFALYTDERSWKHLPEERHTSIEQTRALIEFMVVGWNDDGLSNWVVLTDNREFVGSGGPRLIHGGLVWNIGYRIRPEFWRHGIGTAIAKQGIQAARELRPKVPLTAKVLSRNEASRKTALAAGLTERWRGPEAGRDGLTRLVFADRELSPIELTALTTYVSR